MKLLIQTINSLTNKRQLKKTLIQQSGLIEKKIAILCGSTIGEIETTLELFLLSYGIKPIFWIGNYNRYYEEAVFENRELNQFKPDFIYIHTTNKNIINYPQPGDSLELRNKKLSIEYERFKEIWVKLADQYRCAIIQNNFDILFYRTMGNADSYLQNGKQRFIHELNFKFAESAEKKNNLYLNDIQYISAYYGLEKWNNLSQWYLYKYALDVEAIPLLCHNIANIIKSILGKNKKACILDLDNTLWGGVIGDDGLEGIELGEESATGRAFYDFQKYIKELSEIGILLNVCSKNDLENAKLGFEHTASNIQIQDFTSFIANWERKSENINQIVKDINLIDESVVFLDDNPAEREIVKADHPSIESPDLTTPDEYVKILDQLGYFEVTSLSNDDLKRKTFYEGNKARQLEQSKFSDYQQYLRSLNMNAQIDEFDVHTLERVTQLINKTNQFNFTTIRCTQEEVREIMEDEDYITLKGNLKDKFGDNGIVTVLIAKIEQELATIEIWVMSCRVFQRELELAVFDMFIENCRQREIKRIRGIYRPTAKNKILEGLYASLGFKKTIETEQEILWEYEIPSLYEKKNNVIGVN